MDRKEFLRNTAILGGATILPMNNVFSQNVTENGIGKNKTTMEEERNNCLDKVPIHLYYIGTLGPVRK